MEFIAYENYFFYMAHSNLTVCLWRDCFYFSLGLGYQKSDTVWYRLQIISTFISGLVEPVNNYDGRWMADF